MSTLTLVRHGQATPFEKITDRLSETGVEQARKLGEYWRGRRFDEIVCGNLERHRRTLEALGLGGEPRFDAGWNEYRADEIVAVLSPELQAQDARYAQLAAASREGMQGPDRNRHFQKMLEYLMKAWLNGAVAADGVESFGEFQARVLAALGRIQQGPASRDVVVITSGGPIGLCVQETLHAPPQTFLDVNWRVRNTSLSEFTFSSNRLTLDTFNGLPHLVERSLWTWR